eukprot:gene34789-50661_t
MRAPSAAVALLGRRAVRGPAMPTIIRQGSPKWWVVGEGTALVKVRRTDGSLPPPPPPGGRGALPGSHCKLSFNPAHILQRIGASQ